MGDQVVASNVYRAQPLSRVHLYSTADYGIASPGDIARVQLLSVLALLVLVIACANFVNLVTARSTHRTREVGVRKAIGAHRQQLASPHFHVPVRLSHDTATRFRRHFLG